MPFFEHDALRQHYIDVGDGPPVLLLHGFASNIDMNWRGPGWIDTLGEAGHRVVALDFRGHGESDKPHEPVAYAPGRMASDALALLDHLEIERAALMGYSMGARVAAFATLAAPRRVATLVLGGLGEGLVAGLDGAEGIAEALLAPSLDDVPEGRGRMFRAFADKTRSDRRALAACIGTSREVLTADEVARIEAPTLVAVGTKDDLAGSPATLAAMLPRGTALDIPGRDHMVAVGDKVFKRGVIDFLAENMDVETQR